jgi:protein involved in polysaccharide export with SLBB domain
MLPMKKKWSKLLVFCALAVSAAAMADEPPAGAVVAAPVTAAPATPEAPDPSGYQLQPGDMLTVTVWKETDLQGDVLIRPDGGLSFALAGELHAAGHTVAELTAMLTERIRKFVPDAVVTVAVKAASGNRVYVIGKVTHAGDFALSRPIDVMQALSLAGGATPFAMPATTKPPSRFATATWSTAAIWTKTFYCRVVTRLSSHDSMPVGTSLLHGSSDVHC